MTWVTFTHPSQALPGRRMRIPATDISFFVTKKRTVAGVQQIYFGNKIGAVTVERAKRQRWEIEVPSA
jgi:hypothetical protein